MTQNEMSLKLAALDVENRKRRLKEVERLSGKQITVEGQLAIYFSSNDYLGLANHPVLIAASKQALEKYGTGSTASRLISGNSPFYTELEAATAAWKGKEAALVFNSGYLLNTSLLPVLCGAEDVVFCDRLNHASLIDGIKLSGAKWVVYPHSDLEALEKALKKYAAKGKRWIITDSVFSMDGDIARLPEIASLARIYKCNIFIDEAHATGVLGEQGRGAWNSADGEGLSVLTMGTYSKALGSLGAFIACTALEKEYFVNTCRGVIFTTALPPAVLAASRFAVFYASKMEAERSHLKVIADKVRSAIKALGYDIGQSETQIIPVILGQDGAVLDASRALLKKGFFVPPVRFPAVGKGRARLRLSLSAAHTLKEVDALIKALGEL